MGMLNTNECLKTCNAMKLYETYSERGLKDRELLSISMWDNESEFRDLLLLILLCSKGDVRVKGVLQGIKEKEG